MNEELEQRVAWLERKMVRVLWLLISVTSAGIGFVVAHYTVGDDGGWAFVAVLVVVWLVAGELLRRSEFRGAPGAIEFIDP